MVRNLKVNFSDTPKIKIRVIDKNDSAILTKSKKKYPFVLVNTISVNIIEEKKSLNINFEIPKNYIWNGADIPKCLFWIGQSKDNNYLVASLVHDFMLEKKEYIYNDILHGTLSPKEYRKLTTLVFREILKDEKTNVIKANCMAFAVDVFQKTINFRAWKVLGGN